MISEFKEGDRVLDTDGDIGIVSEAYYSNCGDCNTYKIEYCADDPNAESLFEIVCQGDLRHKAI